jgi:hypothetical protein
MPLASGHDGSRQAGSEQMLEYAGMIDLVRGFPGWR